LLFRVGLNRPTREGKTKTQINKKEEKEGEEEEKRSIRKERNGVSGWLWDNIRR